MTVVVLTNGDDTPAAYGDGDHTINALGGNDVVTVGAGTNSISGGAGNDIITTGGGNVTVSGGDGNDRLNVATTANVVFDAGAGDDSFQMYGAASPGGKLLKLYMGEGNNFVNTFGNHSGGENVIRAGNGENLIRTGFGAKNNIAVGNGNNEIDADPALAWSSDDTISVGDGNNIIRVGKVNDNIYLGNGNNTVTGAEGDKNIRAENKTGDNSITVSGTGQHKVITGSGADTISLGTGNSTVISGAGNDTVSVGEGSHGINTGDGNDVVILAGNADAQVNTGEGDDTVRFSSMQSTSDRSYSIALGEGNNNLAFGTAGYSTDNGLYRGTLLVTAGNGYNDLTLGFGNNTVVAGNGGNAIFTEYLAQFPTTYGIANDSITTGRGNDVINTGRGNDTIRAGWGDDTITLYAGTGGGAADLIIFDTGSAVSNLDSVFGAMTGIGLRINGVATLQLINGNVVAYADLLNQMTFVGLTDISQVTLI